MWAALECHPKGSSDCYEGIPFVDARGASAMTRAEYDRLKGAASLSEEAWEFRLFCLSPTFSTRGENRLFFERNRPSRPLNKGTVCQKWL